MEVFVFDWWWTSHQSPAHKSLRILRFCIVVLERWTRTPNQILHGKIDWRGSKSSPEYRALDRIDGEPMEFEWNIFPGFTTLQLSHKFQELLLRLSITPEKSTDGSSSCRCSTTSHGDQRTTRKNPSQMLNSLLSLQRDSEQDNQWSFLAPGSEKKWYSISEDSPQGEWDKIAEKMMVTLAESGHPVFRATSPLSRGVLKSKGGGKLSIHYCADSATIETVFRTIISVNQLSLYGTVAEMCEEYESYHDRTEGPVVRTIESIVRAKCDQDKHTFELWSCTKRFFIAKIKRTNWKVITTRQIEQILYWCRIPDYSWSRTVFHDERHWRILTIHRFSGFSWVHFAKRRRFIWTKRLDQREHQNLARIGSYNLLPTGKFGVEIRVKSVNKDNSHSWVRISHGLKKLVTNLNNKDQDDNEQETSEMQFEEYALKLTAGDFASRSKGKAKPQRRDSASSSTRTIPIGERTWTDVEPGK